MKKVITWLLVVAMTAAIAVGGTMAYLTDTDEDVNVMTLGNVKIDQLEYERVDTETKDEDAVVQEFHDNKPLYPAVTEDGFNWEAESTVDWGQIGKDGYTSNIWDPDKINNELDKMVFVKNKGTYDAYVRSIFAFEANGYSLNEFKALFHLNINEEDWTWEWEETPVTIPGDTGATNYIIATATYNKVLKPGQLTEISLSQIALDPSAGNADVLGFGDTYQVLVKTQAVQAEGFDDPKSALDEGFGEPTVDNIPWENDSAIRGIDLRTALHYLDGNKSGTKITSKVTNVIFGLTKDHAEIADKYVGTLVDVEQDVPVYAYYVPNGSNYDVYFLASDKIYTPKNSKELFSPMKALLSVDTSNMDVSRTEDMTDMFYNCQKLKNIDTSRWDTSSVTCMYGTFCNCYALETLDVSNWDVSNVTSFRALFSGSGKLKYLDVTNWDTSAATTMHNMFNKCTELEQIEGVGNFVTDNVTSMCQMFAYCKKLKEVPGIDDWQTGNVTDMSFMFRSCFELKELDIALWDTGKCTTFSSMFEYFSGTELPVEDWDVSSCKRTAYMFIYCYNLEELDLSKWDVSNVAEMNNMFESCTSLKSLDLVGWNTSNVVNMHGIFHNCKALTELDLSTFNTAKVQYMGHLCDNSGALTTIYVGDGWSTASVKDNAEGHGNMFNNCNVLVGGNGTRYVDLKVNDKTYALADAEGTPGYLTYKAN